MKEKDVKGFLITFARKFGNTERYFGSKPVIEVASIQTTEILIINRRPIMAKADDAFFPTLLFDELCDDLPQIVVDMGAISHICNGADIMAPGVVRIMGDFNEEDFLLITDERYHKSIAIGFSLFNSQMMRTRKQGKIIKNMHYVGDNLWNAMKKIT
jgi:PUA domain protein